jgi:tetratricopeptide (TPR) repeat protein
MKRTLFPALLALALVLLASGAARAQDDLEKGKQELQAGNTARAIEDFKDFISDNETNAQGYVWLAKAYLAQDSLQKAKAELIKGRALAEASGDIYHMLGDIYMTEKAWVAAEEQYMRAAEFDSTSVALYMKIADAQTKSRKYTPLAKTWQTILVLDPQNVVALRALGTLYVRAKQYANALPVLEKLYPLQPDSIDVQYGYVKSLYETRNYEKMIPIAETLFQRDASLTEVQDWLGDAYVATNAFERLIAIIEGKAPDARTADEWVSLGKAYRSLEQFDKAVGAYEAVVRKDSTRCDILYDMGTAYMKVKDYQKAVAAFNRKIACDTASGYRFASHLNAAMSSMQLKDFKAAEEHTLAAIELRPEHVQAWLTLSQNYVQLGNLPKQRAGYRKVIELATADTTVNGKYERALEEAYRMEGVQELLEKKYPQAIDLLKKSIQINPKHCNTLLLLAQAYHNSNLKEDATKYYCRVIGTCPGGEDAKIAKNGLEILGTGCGGTGK